MRKLFFRFYLFCKNILKRNIRHPRKLLNELNASQFWTGKEMQQHQLRQINKLLGESKLDVPYYRANERGNIDSYTSLVDFSENFPKITKDIIVEQSNRLENPKIKNFAVHATSGSTGVPLKVKVSNEAESYRIANRMRFYKWWDLDFYDKHALIWRLPEHESSFVKKCMSSMKFGLMGRMNIDVFDLDKKTIVQYVEALEKFKPKYIRGYKSGVLEFARLMYDANLRLKKASVKLIIVTSEVLLNEERAFIEEVFGVRVANEYGAADGGQFAFECTQGSLHVNEESVFMTTDENDNLSCTELFNQKMPLINYMNQDRVVFSNKDCSCGKSLKVIDHIVGRTADYIDCSDGTKKHSLIFIGVFNELQQQFSKAIKQFRVIQNGNSLSFEIVKDMNYTKQIEDFISQNVFDKVCNDLVVDFVEVQRIDREPNGKLRYFVKNKPETLIEK